jgi:TetR/AcrR family transcriptional regulator, regulator of mycofactocin system
MAPTASLRGRPAVTTHAEIERQAFRLFADRGFEATTLDAIAERVGVAPRTITRYFASKNDIPWGEFDRTLTHFRDLLDQMPPELPLWERVHRGVMGFNAFPQNANPSHRDRMRLILRTPALVAHSVLRYEQWRAVIAEYVAADRGLDPADPFSRLAGHVSLGIAITAYEDWLAAEPGATPAADQQTLLDLIDRSMAGLRSYLEQ